MTDPESGNAKDASHAAKVLQKAWRQRRGPSLAETQLTSDNRWQDALVQARVQAVRKGAEDGVNDARSRWKRGVFLAGRLEDGEGLLSTTADDQSPLDKLNRRKSLETQVNSIPFSLRSRPYFPFLHCTGLNSSTLNIVTVQTWYHRKWVDEDTKENFFKWLDKGEGRNLSLPECSREQLDKERITYLSAEQRLNYLVKIDSLGHFRWARNNRPVDTELGRWKDAGNGRGIIPADSSEVPGPLSSEISSPSSDSHDDANEATHYQGSRQETGWKRIRKSLTTKGVMERLLRRTVGGNTWIFVSDQRYNVFVGLKETGTFQHSSFLSGGLVTSAGLITVRDGLVTSLSPLSGHYRTSIEHFKYFVEEMEKRGADLHKVKVTNEEAILWGLEHYKKFVKAEKEFTKKQKDRVKNAVGRLSHHGHSPPSDNDAKPAREKPQKDEESSPEEKRADSIRMHRAEEDAAWFANSAWRRDILYGRGHKIRKEVEQKWKKTVDKAVEAESGSDATGDQRNDTEGLKDGGAENEMNTDANESST